MRMELVSEQQETMKMGLNIDINLKKEYTFIAYLYAGYDLCPGLMHDEIKCDVMV